MKVQEIFEKVQTALYTTKLLRSWNVATEFEVYNTYEDETSAIASMVKYKNHRLVVEFNCAVVIEIEYLSYEYDFDPAMLGLPSPDLLKQAILRSLCDLLGFVDYVALKEAKYRDCISLTSDFTLKSIEDFQ